MERDRDDGEKPPWRKMTRDEWLRAREYLVDVVAQRSNLFSRVVHWWGTIETTPRLRIPVPRAFTSRDP